MPIKIRRGFRILVISYIDSIGNFIFALICLEYQEDPYISNELNKENKCLIRRHWSEVIELRNMIKSDEIYFFFLYQIFGHDLDFWSLIKSQFPIERSPRASRHH